MLPLAHRTLENIIYLVEQEMTRVGGARMIAPILTPSALWKKSGENDFTAVRFHCDVMPNT